LRILRALAAGPLQQRRHAEWRDKWHDNRARVISAGRVVALTVGLALIIGYLSASGGGHVDAKPAPASLEPTNAAPAAGTPVQLRLRPVSVPQALRPASRHRKKSNSSSKGNSSSGTTSGQTNNSTPTQSQPTKPTKPSHSGSFDSVG
jgi:hypothetical protein